jgi:hypothetical protein
VRVLALTAYTLPFFPLSTIKEDPHHALAGCVIAPWNGNPRSLSYGYPLDRGNVRRWFTPNTFTGISLFDPPYRFGRTRMIKNADLDDVILRLQRSLRRAKRLRKRSIDLSYQIGLHVHSGRIAAYEECLDLLSKLRINH